MSVAPMSLVQSYVRQATSLPVVSKVPSERPDAFVRVDQGAPQRRNLDQVETSIIVQVYGPNRSQAFQLISKLYQHLDMVLDSDVSVSSWEAQAGPYDFPDPDIPHVSRWQFTGQLITTLDY